MLTSKNGSDCDGLTLLRNGKAAAEPSTTSVRQLRSESPSLAVVGCGYWGAKHVRVCSEIPTARVSTVVDHRSERLEYVRAQYPAIAVSRDFSAILHDEEVDGVIIATPISTHFELARAALAAGKHVLVEKPMAVTSAQCRELNAIAQRCKRVLMVGHTFEYHPAVNFMRQVIRRGGLGDLYYIDSRRLNLGLYQPDTNVLWDLAPHDLSIIFFLLEQKAESIDAWGHAHVLRGIEDIVHATMGFNNGTIAQLHVSWLDPVKVRQVTVVGSEGMLVFDDVQPSEKVRLYDKHFHPAVVGDSYADFQSAYHHGDVRIPSISNTEPLKLEVLDFVNAIVTGEPPLADANSGLRVVEALEAASRCLHVRSKGMNGGNARSVRRRTKSTEGSGIGLA